MVNEKMRTRPATRCALRRKLIADVKGSQPCLEGSRLNLNRAVNGEEEPRGQRAPRDRIAKKWLRFLETRGARDCRG